MPPVEATAAAATVVGGSHPLFASNVSQRRAFSSLHLYKAARQAGQQIPGHCNHLGSRTSKEPKAAIAKVESS